MNDQNEIIAAVKSSAANQAAQIVESARATFLSLFGSFFSQEDLLQIERLFDKAVFAKTAHFSASTKKEAEEAAQEYDAYMASIETIGDQYLIVGKAKAGVFVRSIAHQIISGIFAVAGAVLQTTLGIAIPGVGSLIGAGVNAGLQHVVAHFLGE